MERREPRATVAAPVSALALAAGAAVSFGVSDAVGFLSDRAEDVFILAWLLGWVLLVWAAIISGAYAVVLLRRSLSQRPVLRSEAALGAASLVFIAFFMATHPLWGSGSGFGG